MRLKVCRGRGRNSGSVKGGGRGKGKEELGQSTKGTTTPEQLQSHQTRGQPGRVFFPVGFLSFSSHN